MYQAPEADAEEANRVREAVANGDRLLCDRLFAAAKPGGFEAHFLRRDPITFDTVDRLILQRMAWFYRLRLPSYLRPKRNPDDPIVREMERLDG